MASHELSRLKHDVLSKPQLITPSALASVMEVLSDREGVNDLLREREIRDKLAADLLEKGQPEMAFNLKAGKPVVEPTLSESGKVAQIDIIGPLAHRASMFEGLCGARSYQSLVKDVTAVASVDSVEKIVLNIDSGGGEAAGAFDTARTIKKIAKENGKELIVYSDGMIASAAYALACVADKVVVSESASVGSIGVIMTLQNNKEALDKQGIKLTPVYAGDKKALGHPSLDLTDEDLAIVQSRVDSLFGMFTNLVSEMRDITTESIVEMQALTFLGQDAKEKGLVDELMTAQEFLSSLGDEGELESSFSLNNNTTGDRMTTDVDNAKMAELEAKMAEMTAAFDTQKAEMTADLEAAQTLLKEKADAEMTAKQNGFKEQAQAWEALGVDAEAYAGLAMNADAALLDMFAKVAASASTAVDASAALEEIGADGEGEVETTDPVARTLNFIKQAK